MCSRMDSAYPFPGLRHLGSLGSSMELSHCSNMTDSCGSCCGDCRGCMSPAELCLSELQACDIALLISDKAACWYECERVSLLGIPHEVYLWWMQMYEVRRRATGIAAHREQRATSRSLAKPPLRTVGFRQWPAMLASALTVLSEMCRHWSHDLGEW